MKILHLFLLLLSFVHISTFAHPDCDNTDQKTTQSSFNKYTMIRCLGMAALGAGPIVTVALSANSKNFQKNHLYAGMTAGLILFATGGIVAGSPKIKKWEKELQEAQTQNK